jgi:hypothetical protein
MLMPTADAKAIQRSEVLTCNYVFKLPQNRGGRKAVDWEIRLVKHSRMHDIIGQTR